MTPTATPTPHHLLPTPWLRRELLAQGHDDRWIARSMRAGFLERVRHGGYVDRGAWVALSPADQHRVRARAVLKALARPVALSHVTAAVELGAPTWGLDLGLVHVTMTDGRGAQRSVAGVRQHAGRIEADDVVTIGDVDVVPAARVAVEIMATTPAPVALSVVCDLLHRKVVERDAVLAFAETMRQWPGMVGSHVVGQVADAAIASVLEARFAHFCFVNALPAPQLQREVRLPDGSTAYLDFAWPELGVWVEVDGKEKYLKHRREGESVADAVVREKGREDAVRFVTGWRCLRLTWADLENPRRLLMVLRDFLASPAA